MASYIDIPFSVENQMEADDFIGGLPEDDCAHREELILQAFQAGFVPEFMMTLCPVTTAFADADGTPHEGTFFVTPDYLCIGKNEKYVRVPMGPLTAQSLCDQFGALLPTSRMVDAIWHDATGKLAPQAMGMPQYRYDDSMKLTSRFVTHNEWIQKSLGDMPPGQLVAGIKKDVIIDKCLVTKKDRVVIYGWHQLSSIVIQGVNCTSHDIHYKDYSHGIRLIASRMMVDGDERNVVDVLADPVFYKLLSNEGPLVHTRYGA